MSGRLNKQGKGVALVSELLNKDQTTKLLGGESGKADWSFLSEVFTSMKAFKAVVFKIEQDKPMDATPEGAFFYYLRGYMQVIDLADGRVVNTYSTEVVKGGGFNKKAAWDKALDDLRQEFLMNMAMVDF